MVQKDADQQFLDDLMREDDVGLILRGHLHAEHQLVELLTAVLPMGDRCDWSKISFFAKVESAYGCGLPLDVKDLLAKIGTLRNNFAHRLDAEITKKEVLALYNGLSARHRNVLKGSYKKMNGAEFPKPASLDPRDLLIIVLMCARQATKAAVTHLTTNVS